MRFLDLFRRPKVELATRLPRGRVSLPPDTFGNVLHMLEARYNLATPFYPYEFLKLLYKLSWANPDVSQAIGNIVNLGNTGHRVNLEGANDAAIEKAAERLSELARNAYREGAGIDGLINQLFTQLAITGALSIEWCPDKGLTKVERVVIVPVEDIRFRVDEGGYTAFQMSTTLLQAAQNLVELNPLTYVYFPLTTSGRNPYGIPPFLAVLPDIYIQQDMKDNIKYIIRKYGLLGFVTLTLGKPSKRPGEADEEYAGRLNAMLKEYIEDFSKEYRQGFGVTFEDVKIDHHSIASDKGAGMEDIFRTVEEQIASALHTDPALLGRSYSTTETYAGVVYQKFINQLENMRRLIKRAIERGYLLDLELSGLPITDVSLTFKPNAVLEPEKTAKAEETKIKNVLTKRDTGIIDQDQAARELGYEAPAGEAVSLRPTGGMMERKEFIYSPERMRYTYNQPRIALAEDLLEPRRKAGGGFSSNERELWFQAKKIEFEGYRRKFAQELARMYRQQRDRITTYLEGFDDDLTGLTDVWDWLNWRDEEKKFGDMAHPKLTGIFADAASKIHEGFVVTPDHKNRIRVYADKFAGLVNVTTMKQLTKVMAEAQSGQIVKAERRMQEGDEESEEEPKLVPKAALLVGVLAVYKFAQGARTRTAAWTETHNAQGFGITEGIREEGGEEKQWVCAFNNSREEHMEADGQKVGIDMPFVVMGEAIMWPGEGSMENSANCQCTVMMVRVGGK